MAPPSGDTLTHPILMGRGQVQIDLHGQRLPPYRAVLARHSLVDPEQTPPLDQFEQLAEGPLSE